MKTTISTLAIAFTIAASTLTASAQTKTAPLSNPDFNASVLVSSAFRNISKNYTKEDCFISAYYKEVITKNDKAFSLNEAILDIDKASYLTSKPDKIAVKNVRLSSRPKMTDPFLVKLQGGPNTSLILDLAKYPFLGCEPSKINDYYTFEYETPVNIDNKLFYVVRFDQKYLGEDILFRGKLYIEAISHAIGKVEFAMNVEKRGDAYLNFVKDKPSYLNIDVKYANYTVGYKEFNNKWLFEYSRSDVKFEAKNKKRGIFNEYLISSKMVVTKVNAPGVKIDKNNIMRSTDILADRVQGGDDSLIWELYDELMLLALL
ncbi:MAG: hypothetical protein PHI95_05545 [Bacteroidales bacterium]|nr:hypothetical protein [Bacteroidales bacterium]MDD4293371.1 hypothetical protein [Bacteroidales bacterium]HNW49234.1 hypothetical protein [Bacteroidales bacterium]HPS95490.1 hypothetical protein [Bacteroidales bacterium]